jgi:hypothetical protein
MATDAMAVDLAPTDREVAALRQVTQRLHERFPQVPATTVEATVALQYHRFDDSRIRDFVPIFVERNAREELMAQAS